MANEEQYRFNVDADVQAATQNLNKIIRLMNTIESLRGKAVNDNFTTNQKDMDKGMRTMTDLSKSYKLVNQQLEDMKKKLRDVASQSVPNNASKKQIDAINNMKAAADKQYKSAIQQQKSLQSAYTQTLQKFREMANFQQNYSKNFKSVMDSNKLYNMPNDFATARKTLRAMSFDNKTSGTINDLNKQIREAQKMDRRNDSLSRRGAAASYVSSQQASNFRRDYRASQGQYKQDWNNNLDVLARLGMERSRLDEQAKNIRITPETTQAERDRKINLEQSIRAIDEEMETRMELNRVLEQTMENMKTYNERLATGGKNGGGVEEKPERGTFRGMVYERAPAIGLAMGGAFAGALGGLYAKGASLSKDTRDDVISIGQRTGMSGENWQDNIMHKALEEGISNKLGFGGQDMLSFENAYLSNQGYTNMKDLNTATQNEAIFSRVTGMNASDTADFFSSLFNSGSVNGSQVKDIQDAFVGGIKSSGMEGREKEQLKTLQGIMQNVAQGRTLSNSDVMNVMALQSILGSSGQRSLQGAQGGQVLDSLGQGIRNGINDPQTRLLFGQGTKYQGMSGLYQLRKQLDKGISDPDNIKTIARAAVAYGGDNKEAQYGAFASIAQARLGTSLTAEQAKGIMDLYNSGKFDQDSIDKVINRDKSKGAKESSKKLESYQSSKEARDNESEAVTAKQAQEFYDMVSIVRDVNSQLGKMNAALYAATAAVTAFAVAAAASAGSFVLSRGVRKVAAKSFKGGPEGGGPTLPTGGGKGGPEGGSGGGLWSKMKTTVGGWFDPNVRKGGLPNESASSSGGIFASLKSGAGRLWDSIKGKGGGSGGNMGIIAEGTPSATGTGWFGSLGRAVGGLGSASRTILNKGLLPLSMITGGIDIAKAPKDKKGATTGKVAGGILGGLAGGAAAGAAIGSVVPVAGTAVGGIVGGAVGIGGSIIGSLAGSHIGTAVGSWFDPKSHSEKKSPSKSKESDLRSQVDRENTNTEERNEVRRQNNVAQDAQNLSYYDKLLTRAHNLLDQAAMQNGIIGSVDAATGSSGSMNGNAPTASGNSNSSKIWNFLASKGMSASAIAGVMGNLQQESGLNPNAPGGGLAQWIGSRKTALDKYAKSQGLSPNSLQAQLGYLWKEMSSGKYGDMSKMNSMTPSEAADYFEKNFEKAGKPMLSKREKYADNFYSQYGTAAQTSSSSGTKVSSSNHNVKVDSNINVKVSGDESVSDKVNSSSELKKIGDAIQSKIYGAMSFFSKEMAQN